MERLHSLFGGARKISETVGIVAFSFGLAEDPKDEPNPCNIAIANAVRDIYNEQIELGRKVIIVAQWEVARAIYHSEQPVSILYFVKPHADGSYLSTEDVAREAGIHLLNREDPLISTVFVAANPFLHEMVCKREMKKQGFKDVNGHKANKQAEMFWPQSKQWYTRSKKALFAYAALKTLHLTRGVS